MRYLYPLVVLLLLAGCEISQPVNLEVKVGNSTDKTISRVLIEKPTFGVSSRLEDYSGFSESEIKNYDRIDSGKYFTKTLKTRSPSSGFLGFDRYEDVLVVYVEIVSLYLTNYVTNLTISISNDSTGINITNSITNSSTYTSKIGLFGFRKFWVTNSDPNQSISFSVKKENNETNGQYLKIDTQ